MKVCIYLTKNRYSISDVYDLDIPYNDGHYYYQEYCGGGEKLYLITTNPNLGDSYFDNISSSTTYYNQYGSRPVWFKKIGEEDLDWVDEEEFYSILNGIGWIDNSTDPFVTKYLSPIYKILEKYARGN